MFGNMIVGSVVLLVLYIALCALWQYLFPHNPALVCTRESCMDAVMTSAMKQCNKHVNEGGDKYRRCVSGTTCNKDLFRKLATYTDMYMPSHVDGMASTCIDYCKKNYPITTKRKQATLCERI